MPSEKKAYKLISEAITQVLGREALQSYSPSELKKLLGISASQETLRLILKEGHNPRKRTLDRILSEISATHASRDAIGKPELTAADFYGEETRNELVDIFGSSDTGLLRVDTSLRDNPSDLIIHQFGGQRLLVRCLDDSMQPKLPNRGYFDLAVTELSQIIKRTNIERAMLVTHTSPSQEEKAKSTAEGVTIEAYSEIIGSVLQLHSIRDYYEQKLKDRSIFEGYQSQRATELQLPLTDNEGQEPTENPINDSFHRLLEFVENRKGPAIATILGSYGTGKSSLLFKIAHRLAQRSVEGPTNWIIPVWLNAMAIDTYGNKIEQALIAALQEIAPTCRIGVATFKRLLRDGRILVIVDGFDESFAFRTQARLTALIQDLIHQCGPNGRLIVSTRQEIFDNRNDEIQTFVREPAAVDVHRSLVLRMQPLQPVQIENILRSRLGTGKAALLIKELNSRDEIKNLAERPIFLHIIAETSEKIIGRENPPTTLDLFDLYARQWVDQEQEKITRLALDEEERLSICEMMALHFAKHPNKKECATAADLERLAINELKPHYIRNLPAFVLEARVSMFLERQSNTDCFKFSHPSLADYFLGRLLGRELSGHKLITVGGFPMPKARTLLRNFIVQFITKVHKTVENFIDNILRDQLNWEYETDESSLSDAGNPEPPFDIGPYRYLIPNLTALLVEAHKQSNKSTPVINLSGAHLAMIDMSEILPSEDLQLILDAANSEFAKTPNMLWEKASKIGTLGPVFLNGNSSSYEPDVQKLKDYCQVHRLNAPSRFSSDKRDTFILVPGGKHKIMGHYVDEEGKDQLREENVTIHSFLIQKYPVTNGQFLAFLQACPSYMPKYVRRSTSNDYYLAGWPENDLDPRWKDQDWLERPVVYVNWFAARAFAAASGLRLPTEVEWEVAARLAQGSTLEAYPWGNEELTPEWADYKAPNIDNENLPLLPQISVYKIPDNLTKWMQKSGWEIPVHTVGLVREWVADCWDPFYPCKPQYDATPYPLNSGFIYSKKDGQKERSWMPAHEEGDHRVLRGGSFQRPAEDITCHYRAPQRATNVNPDAGFRCVRPIRVQLRQLSR